MMEGWAWGRLLLPLVINRQMRNMQVSLLIDGMELTGESYRVQLKHHPHLSAPTLAYPIGKGDNSSWTTFH